jgi:hypothetical protein
MPALVALTQAFALTIAANAGPAADFPAPLDTPLAGTQVDAAQPDKPAEKPPEKRDPEKKEADPKEPPADPSTEDVLRDMEKQRGDAPAPIPSTAPPVAPANPGASASAGAPGAAPANLPAARPTVGRLLREGTFLVDRRGRMVRTANGDWTFSFDADAQNQADPTMVLMPCQSLEAMEKLATRYGEALTLKVTGQVFVYKNRNYILPARFQVIPMGGDIKTTQ